MNENHNEPNPDYVTSKNPTMSMATWQRGRGWKVKVIKLEPPKTCTTTTPSPSQKPRSTRPTRGKRRSAGRGTTPSTGGRMICVHCKEDLTVPPHEPESTWTIFNNAQPDNKAYLCLSCMYSTHARPVRVELKQLADNVYWALNGPEHGVCRQSDVDKSLATIKAFFNAYGIDFTIPCHLSPPSIQPSQHKPQS